MINESLQKDILRKFCVLKILYRQIMYLNEIPIKPEFVKYLFTDEEERSKIEEEKKPDEIGA